MTSPNATKTKQHKPPAERSVGELVSEISSDLSMLFRQEVALAKTELRQEARAGGKAAGMGAGAAFAGWMLGTFASLALMFALAGIDALNFAWGAVIVAVLWAVVGAVLAARAKKLAKQVGPPHETIDSLKEDKQWAHTQLK
jgi:hypothetical protein